MRYSFLVNETQLLCELFNCSKEELNIVKSIIVPPRLVLKRMSEVGFEFNSINYLRIACGIILSQIDYNGLCPETDFELHRIDGKFVLLCINNSNKYNSNFIKNLQRFLGDYIHISMYHKDVGTYLHLVKAS